MWMCGKNVDVWQECGCVARMWMCDMNVDVWHECGCVARMWMCGKNVIQISVQQEQKWGDYCGA